MTDSSPQDLGFPLLSRLLDEAKKRGATDASATLSKNEMLVVDTEEALPNATRGDGVSLSAVIYVGKKAARMSTNILDEGNIDRLLDNALVEAGFSEENPYIGLAAPDQISVIPVARLDLADTARPEAPELYALARSTQEEARAAMARLTQDDRAAGWIESTEATAAWQVHESFVLATNGLKSHDIETGYRLSVMAMNRLGDREEKIGEYASSTAVHFSDLDTPDKLGARAARRGFARLKEGPVKPGQFPVIFSPRAAISLLETSANFASGERFIGRQSFLGMDDIGRQVFAPGIDIVDNALLPRGLGSRSVDSNGLPAGYRRLVRDGVLEDVYMSLAAARELGVKPNGTGGGPSNLFMHGGTLSHTELIQNAGTGLYVMELMGSNVNTITGDYSRSAAGLWIEDGKVSHAVGIAPISGNLKDMFMNLVPASNLNLLRSSIAAPTILVRGMTIGG